MQFLDYQEYMLPYFDDSYLGDNQDVWDYYCTATVL